MTFLDLQFNVFPNRTRLPLTVAVGEVFTKGHWEQFVVLHFWFGNVVCSVLSFLFWTILSPMDGFFFNAITIFVSPMICCNASTQSCIILVNSL